METRLHLRNFKTDCTNVQHSKLKSIFLIEEDLDNDQLHSTDEKSDAII